MSEKVVVVSCYDMLAAGIENALRREGYDTVETCILPMSALDSEITTKVNSVKNAVVIVLDETVLRNDMEGIISSILRGHPKSKLVLLLHQATPTLVKLAIKLQFTGIVCLCDPLEKQLPDIIRNVIRGRINQYSPSVEKVRDQLSHFKNALTGLTIAQLQVLNLMQKKLKTADIEKALSITRQSIYQHQKRIRQAFRVENNEELLEILSDMTLPLEEAPSHKQTKMIYVKTNVQTTPLMSGYADYVAYMNKFRKFREPQPMQPRTPRDEKKANDDYFNLFKSYRKRKDDDN